MSSIDKLAYRRQPNSLRCFVCGLESPVGLRLRFSDNGEDQVIAEYTVSRDYQGYPGVVHGGIVAAMLDETGGRTIMIGHPNRFMMTATMDVRYRKPVPVETPLTLVGRKIRDRGRLAEVHSEILLPDGSIAAEADLKLAAIPDNYVPEANLQALGWQIYPE